MMSVIDLALHSFWLRPPLGLYQIFSHATFHVAKVLTASLAVACALSCVAEIVLSIYKGYVNSYAITNIRVRGIKALQYLKHQDLRLKEYLRKHNGMKVMLQVFATLKSKKTNEDVRQVIKSRRYNITNEGEIPNVLNQMGSDVEHQAEVMEVSESGLVITQIDKLKFNYDKYNPTRGGKFIPLPKWVSNKNACINIKNQDETCFKYSVQCGICKVYEKDHPERVSHYKNLNDELNWDNVNFPSSDVDIDTFEENNGGKIAVNVYFLDPEEGKQSILLYRQSKVSKASHQVSLLKLKDGDDYNYVFIKDYDKIIGSQTNKMKAKKHHYFHCQHGFLTKELLDEHVEKGCMAVEGQQIQMPKEDDIMVFKNHYKKLKAPFVIYADFECLTTRTGTVSTKEVKTDKYQHHRPCGFMINVVNSIDGSSKPFLYRGEDCMDVFIQKIQKIIEVKDEVMEKMKENKEIIFNANNRRDFNTATKPFGFWDYRCWLRILLNWCFNYCISSGFSSSFGASSCIGSGIVSSFGSSLSISFTTTSVIY